MYDYAKNKSKLIDSRGVRLTVGLFEELNDGSSGVKPVFKLSDWRKKYVELADPTGYQAAMELLGDWEHWLLIIKSPSFAPHLAQWNVELEIKLRSEGIKQLLKQCKLPTGISAAKWLAEAGFIERDKRTKKGKQEEEAAARDSKANVAADAKRLGLVSVK